MLYPRAFRERLGESMRQTFDDLCAERKNQRKPVHVFVLFTFVETLAGIVREHVLQIRPGDIMKNITDPIPAASISFILALPIGLLAAIFFFDIELLQAPVKYALSVDGQQVNMFGRVVLLGGMLALPVAFVLDLVPMIKSFRTGGKLAAHPANLIVGVLIFALMTVTWGGLVLETVRCGMGISCD